MLAAELTWWLTEPTVPLGAGAAGGPLGVGLAGLGLPTLGLLALGLLALGFLACRGR